MKLLKNKGSTRKR